MKTIPGLLDYSLMKPAAPAAQSAESESGIPVQTDRPPSAASANTDERIRILAAQGLKPRDISALLGVHPMIVLRLLSEPEARP